jgi:hypothetical protein
MIDPRKRRLARKHQATPKRGWGGVQNEGDYGTHPGPRVGGDPVKPSGLKSASRSQVRRARQIKRRLGTGRGASRAARSTY